MMFKYLKKVTSARNLFTSAPSGQVVTVMILLMVALLVIILITANIGQVSLNTTNVSNASDTAVLSLGSQLSSKAYSISQQLVAECGHSDQCCVKTGLLALVLAIIIAIVAIVIAVVSYSAGAPLSTYIIAGAIGGLIGGFVGGYIVTGTLKGAVIGGITGAVVGASIGYGVGAAAGAPSTIGAGETVGAGGGTAGAGCSVDGVAVAANSSIQAGSTITAGTATSYAGTSGAVTAAASVAANIYTASENQKDLGAAMSTFSKSLNAFPEYERFREGAFLNALTMVVDDPNTQKDDGSGKRFDGSSAPYANGTSDIDHDGKTNEYISDFLVWWKNKRYNDVSNCISPTVSLTEGYMDKLKTFRDSLSPFVAQLDRNEVECPCQTPEGSEGSMIKLWRDCQSCVGTPIADDINFWEPGPDQTTLLSWYQDPSCEECALTTPTGYDQVDASRYRMEDFLQTTRRLVFKSPAELNTSYNDWIGILDADGATDYAWSDECGSISSSSEDDEGLVDALSTVKDAMGEWQIKTAQAREDAPRCALTNVASAEEIETQISPPGDPVNCSPVADDANSDTPSVSPCHWQKTILESSTGAYFSNYPCRIKSPAYGDAIDEGALIIAQIGNVRVAVLGIEQDVKDKNPPPEDAEEESVKYTINITSVALTGTVLQKCSTESGAGEEATLIYSGTATLEYDTEDTNTVYTCPDGSQVSQGTKCSDGSDPTASSTTTTTHHTDPITLTEETIIVPDAGGLTITAMDLNSFNTTLNNFEARVNAYTDPFLPVITTIETNKDLINQFVIDTAAYVAAMKAANPNWAHNGSDYPNGCYGPPTYSWTDSRGSHSVTVTTGAWKVPRTHTEKHGNWLKGKKCTVLACYEDNGETWVKVQRTDETGKQVTTKTGNVFSLFHWNPSHGAINKKAKAYWNGRADQAKLELR